VTLFIDLESFVRARQPHGQLTGDATEPTASGYSLWIACPSGARFELRISVAARSRLNAVRPPLEGMSALRYVVGSLK